MSKLTQSLPRDRSGLQRLGQSEAIAVISQLIHEVEGLEATNKTLLTVIQYRDDYIVHQHGNILIPPSREPAAIITGLEQAIKNLEGKLASYNATTKARKSYIRGLEAKLRDQCAYARDLNATIERLRKEANAMALEFAMYRKDNPPPAGYVSSFEELNKAPPLVAPAHLDTLKEAAKARPTQGNFMLQQQGSCHPDAIKWMRESAICYAKAAGLVLVRDDGDCLHFAKITKVNPWRTHYGKGMPEVLQDNPDAGVEVRYRHPSVGLMAPQGLQARSHSWEHHQYAGDIMQWRYLNEAPDKA